MTDGRSLVDLGSDGDAGGSTCRLFVMCMSQTSVFITTQQDGGHQGAESVVGNADVEARGAESKAAGDSLMWSNLWLYM